MAIILIVLILVSSIILLVVWAAIENIYHVRLFRRTPKPGDIYETRNCSPFSVHSYKVKVEQVTKSNTNIKWISYYYVDHHNVICSESENMELCDFLDEYVRTKS